MSKANRFNFRAWDEENKMWRIGYITKMTEGTRRFWAIINENGDTRWYIHDEKTIGISTGLTDLHGREGFKGSIFKIRSGNHYWVYEVAEFPEITGGNLCAVCREHNVSFDEDGGRYTYKTVKPKMVIRDCISKIKRGTIIGNIHENPELLQATG